MKGMQDVQKVVKQDCETLKSAKNAHNLLCTSTSNLILVILTGYFETQNCANIAFICSTLKE